MVTHGTIITNPTDSVPSNLSPGTDFTSILAQDFSKFFIPQKDSVQSNCILFLINQD